MKNAFHILCILLLTGGLLGLGSCKAKKNKPVAESGNNSGQVFESVFIDGCTNFNLGNYSFALKNFIKCSEIKPDEASVYYQLSRVYAQTGNKGLSLQNALKANQLAPSNLFYAQLYAGKLRAEGQYPMAIEVLEKSHKIDPKDEQIVKSLDSLYMIRNEPAKRIALWKSFLESGNFKITTALKLIELYKSVKDNKSAHLVYEQIKKAAPLKYQYFINDANLYLSENDELNANLNFEKALAINPNNFELNHSLFLYYQKKKDKAQAGKFLKMAFEDIYSEFNTKLKLCSELNLAYKLDSGNAYYTLIAAEQLELLYPNQPNALFTSAQFYEQNGHYTRALNNFNKSCNLNPNMFDAWKGALRCAEAMKLYAQILIIAEKSLEYYPNVAFLYAKASMAANKTGNFLKALEYAKSGLSFALETNDKCELLTQEGLAYFRLKRYAESLVSLGSALTINDAGYELYDYLGNTLYHLNKTNEAVQNWIKSKEKGNTSSALEKKILEKKYYE